MDQENQPVSPEANAKINNAGGKGIFTIMAEVFYAPGQAFSSFKANPTILIPLILTIVIAGITASFTAPYSAKLQYEIMKESPVMPQESLDQMERKQHDTNPLYGAVGGAIAVTIFGFVYSLFAMFMGNVVMGGEAKLKAIWGTVILGGLISTIGGLIKVPLILAKESAQVSIGLAALFSGKTLTSVAYSFLFYMDFFIIWAMIVTGIGFSHTFNISKSKGLTISIIISTLFILVLTGLTLIGFKAAQIDITFF